MYERQVWENGDVITAEKLNHMERGIERFVVTFSGTSDNGDASCDKTFSEILEAYSQGKQIVLRYLHYPNYYDLLKCISTRDDTIIEINGSYYNVVDPYDLEKGCISIAATINSLHVSARYVDI